MKITDTFISVSVPLREGEGESMFGIWVTLLHVAVVCSHCLDLLTCLHLSVWLFTAPQQYCFVMIVAYCTLEIHYINLLNAIFLHVLFM